MPSLSSPPLSSTHSRPHFSAASACQPACLVLHPAHAALPYGAHPRPRQLQQPLGAYTQIPHLLLPGSPPPAPDGHTPSLTPAPTPNLGEPRGGRRLFCAGRALHAEVVHTPTRTPTHTPRHIPWLNTDGNCHEPAVSVGVRAWEGGAGPAWLRLPCSDPRWDDGWSLRAGRAPCCTSLGRLQPAPFPTCQRRALSCCRGLPGPPS